MYDLGERGIGFHALREGMLVEGAQLANEDSLALPVLVVAGGRRLSTARRQTAKGANKGASVRPAALPGKAMPGKKAGKNAHMKLCRTTVLPLRDRLVQPVPAHPRFPTVAAMVEALRPADPVHCFHPEALAETVREFLAGFPGTVFYAIKTNPDPYILERIHQAGVQHFDVASLGEIEQVRRLLPQATLAFMHPIKSRKAIRAAYYTHGVRIFSIDTAAEIDKILDETDGAQDITLHVRMKVELDAAVHGLATKFGASYPETVALLRYAASHSPHVGLCFHVGSQCMDPTCYRDTILRAGAAIAESGVEVEVLDLGGGFPVAYPGMEPPPLQAFFTAIAVGLAAVRLPEHCQIWCEPGRALAAAAETLVLRVEARKGNTLYLNDGTYGCLFDAGILAWRYPMTAIRPDAETSPKETAFDLFGPTCDSIDYMKGPFYLPEDLREGDWIEIGQQGAYARSVRSRFNGFYSDYDVEIAPP
jgi:ornithine decarboxylase